MLAKIPIPGRIVKETYIGAAHVLVSDAAYAGKTRKETGRVLEEAAQASLRILSRSREERKK